MNLHLRLYTAEVIIKVKCKKDSSHYGFKNQAKSLLPHGEIKSSLNSEEI